MCARKYKYFHRLLLLCVTLVSTAVYPQSNAVIDIDSTITYQTISGWEATTEIGQTGFPNLIHIWEDTVVQLAVNELGINRLRLEIRSGSENPVDYFALYLSGQISYNEWKAHRYEIINDNSDPMVIDTSGFQFTELDFRIEHIVNPFRELLTARGEQLYVNLNVVDFAGSQGNSNVQYQDEPAEYAEFILATFLHIQQKYGWVPDAVEIILEPNLADWGNGTNVGNALVAAGDLLQDHGFTPDFIVPSTSKMNLAVSWFDQLIQVPGALSYITELSYHRYGGVSTSNLQAIAQRSLQYGIGSAMLEHIGSGYTDLHEDLKTGLNTAWQQFTLAFPNPPDFGGDNGAQYFWIDISDTDNVQVLIGDLTKSLRQYFKFIRAGAVRLEAVTNNNEFDPLAFVNTDGRFVVVVKADQGGSFSISGLPGGIYGIKYTTENEYDVDLPDITINNGDLIYADIPQPGVITIYEKNSPTINHPPVISPLPEIRFPEDDSLIYPISNWFPLVEDPETPDEDLIYQLLPGNAVTAELVDTSYVFHAPANWFGEDTLRLIVSDGSLADTAQLYVTVTSVNDPPVIQGSLPDSIFISDAAPVLLHIWSFVDDVETPDSLLDYSFAANPDTLLFDYNPGNGDLTISLEDTDFTGEIRVYFTVVDDSGASAEDSTRLIVEIINKIDDPVSERLPDKFQLFQNYPNPFNPTTRIDYALPHDGHVNIEIFNILGQRVKVLVNSFQTAGFHSIKFHAEGIPSGVYFYTITADEFSDVKKMILLK